jgi:CheY-like chemotaxis protein
MDLLPEIIKSVASLLWPVIVVFVILYFCPHLAEIVKSAGRRKFTLKSGSFELTMDEFGEQQQTLIADLQTKILELSKRMEGLPGPSSGLQELKSVPPALPSNSILWVDDNPKNNSYFTAQLAKRGVTVDLALSTSEAIARLEKGQYRVIISDMGREEDGQSNYDAGLDLLKYVRDRDATIPFVLFCHPNAVRDFGAQAREMGATGITSSPTDLFAILGLDRSRQ